MEHYYNSIIIIFIEQIYQNILNFSSWSKNEFNSFSIITKFYRQNEKIIIHIYIYKLPYINIINILIAHLLFLEFQK